jgi:hypothetical protein
VKDHSLDRMGESFSTSPSFNCEGSICGQDGRKLLHLIVLDWGAFVRAVVILELGIGKRGNWEEWELGRVGIGKRGIWEEWKLGRVEIGKSGNWEEWELGRVGIV